MRHRHREWGTTDPEQVWESLWKDKITPWDLGRPTPVLEHELNNRWKEHTSRRDPASASSSTCLSSLRTLVPGCGSGHDLVTIARHHDNLIANGYVKDACVVGLDLSETSLQMASEVMEAFYEFSPFERPTRVKLVKGDYFQDPTTWNILYCYGGCESSAIIEGDANRHHGRHDVPLFSPDASFDFIFDYTFFCALPPSLRTLWGKRTGELLNQTTGLLFTILFPVLNHKDADDESLKGPPFAVSDNDYKSVLEPHGLFLETPEPYASPHTVDSRVGMELVGWWAREKPNHHMDGRAKL